MKEALGARVEQDLNIVSPVLAITENLLVELEAATLEIGRQVGGKRFAKELRSEQEAGTLWTPQTLERIEHARLARVHDSAQTPETSVAELIINRAAEVQAGRKPAKSIGKKALKALRVTGSAEDETSISHDFAYPEILDTLTNNWPKSHAALRRVLASEAEQTKLDRFVRDCVLSPFESDESVLEILRSNIEAVYQDQVAEAMKPVQVQAVIDMHDELWAATGNEEYDGHGKLAVTDETIAPIAVLLTTTAAAYTHISQTTDIRESAARVARDIRKLANSDRGLVFDKRYGIGEMSDFGLVFKEAPTDNIPHCGLEMNVSVFYSDNEPRQLRPVSESTGIWSTHNGRDLISLAYIGNEDIRAIGEGRMTEALNWATSRGVLDVTLRTLVAKYVDSPDDMPILDMGFQEFLQVKFKENVLEHLVIGVYQMAQAALNRPYVYMDKFFKSARDTTFEIIGDDEEPAAQAVRTQALSVAQRFAPKDMDLVRADLRFRGIGDDKLCQLMVEVAIPMIMDNHPESTALCFESLTTISNAFFGSNIGTGQLERYLKEFDINAARRAKLPRRRGW